MTDIKTYLKKFSEDLFSTLKSDEDVSLNLHSEESDFIRFNASKVRQNTSVNQHDLNMVYKSNQRQYSCHMNLSLDLVKDLQFAKTKIEELRRELPKTEANPKFSPIVNNGTSEIGRAHV